MFNFISVSLVTKCWVGSNKKDLSYWYQNSKLKDDRIIELLDNIKRRDDQIADRDDTVDELRRIVQHRDAVIVDKERRLRIVKEALSDWTTCCR